MGYSNEGLCSWKFFSGPAARGDRCEVVGDGRECGRELLGVVLEESSIIVTSNKGCLSLSSSGDGVAVTVLSHENHFHRSKRDVSGSGLAESSSLVKPVVGSSAWEG